MAAAPGASALSSGALDLAADPQEVAGEPWVPRPSLRDLYAQARTRSPEHPLTRAGLEPSQALSLLGALIESLGHFIAPQADQPLRILPTDMGTFKSTASASIWAAPGHLPDLAQVGRVGLCDFHGYPGFHGPSLARSLAHLARRGGLDLDIRPVSLSPLRRQGEALMNPVDLARLLEEPETARRLAEEAARVSQAHRLGWLLLPPVMGLGAWPRVRDALFAAAPCSELLSSTMPSVPGLRLLQAADQALTARGVLRHSGRVVEPILEHPRHLSGVRLEDGRELRAEALVLCTGKFFGGGIRHEERLFEPLFGLPVFIETDGPDPGHLPRYWSRKVGGPHALLRAGLRVDARLCPQDRLGEPAFDNLVAAGSVLGGYDYIRGRDGLGTALLTGWLAGQAAAGSIRNPEATMIPSTRGGQGSLS